MMTQYQVVTNHVAAQANLGVGPQPQPNASTLTSRICDLMRMNPPTFHGTKVYEYPQGFIDDVYATYVTPREKAELADYQVKDVAQVWFEKWRDKRPLREGLED